VANLDFNGQRLKIARVFRGLTQSEVAVEVAASTALISQLESEGRDPSTELLEALSHVLGFETGFFVGFFLPGDSLLVTAGILSAGGVIPLRWLLVPVMLCAIVGDQIGYWIGRSAGAALYRREDSFFFPKSHLQRAHDFYEKYGGRAVILARFVPIIRTFCPPVAGAAKMTYSRYLVFDIFGGIFWVGAMILGSYSLGHLIPNIARRIHYVIAVVILLSILPVIISFLRARSATAAPAAEGK
jgi:membrane-associated protein